MAMLLPVLALLLAGAGLRSAAPAHALPIVDPGLFVIMGVKTCRAGSGYCLLGNDCTLDEDFLPDDRHGHCDGLRTAFTPSAHFVCCRYSAEANATDAPTAAAATTTTTTATTDEASTTETAAATTQTEQQPYEADTETTEGVEHRATEQAFGETTTEGEWSTTRLVPGVQEENNEISDKKKTSENDPVKRTRIDLKEEQKSPSEEYSFTVAETTTYANTDIPHDFTTTENPVEESTYEFNEYTTTTNSQSEDLQKNEDNENSSDAEENKNSIDSFTSNGIMMHDVLKLITEGQWQISFKNNEIGDEANPDDTTEENDTDSPLYSTVFDEQTEATEVSDLEKTTTNYRQNPTMTEFSTETYSTTSIEEYTLKMDDVVSKETSVKPATSASTAKRKITTVSPQTKTDLETEIVIKERVGQEGSNTHSPVSTTNASNEPTSTTETSDSNVKTKTPTVSTQSDVNLEMEIVVKDKAGQEAYSTPSPVATTASVNGPTSTAEYSDTNETSALEREMSQGLCLGDAIREGDCWLVRFVDHRFDNFLCHGAMVDGDLVITSAVCAISMYQAGTSNVRVISSGAAKPPMQVLSIAVHEEFRPRALDSARFDLGLVRVTPRSSCLLCMAGTDLELSSAACYTFAGASQGDGDVKLHKCKKVVQQQEFGGNISVQCTLPEEDKLQVHSGAPLVCQGALAGVAFSSPGAPSFTPAAQLLPWVRWNVKKL